MKATDVKLSSLTEELIRLGEIVRQREPAMVESGDALVGIRRQLAAAEVPSEMELVGNGKTGTKKSKDKTDSSQNTKRQNPKPKRINSQSRSQLLRKLISDVEHLTLMLASKEVASEEASNVFEKFRQTVVETASQRRKHLVDLAYLHSLVAGLKSSEARKTETEATQTKTKTDETQAKIETPETETTQTKAAKSKPAKSKESDRANSLSAILVEVEDMYQRCGGTIINDYSEEDKACFQISGKGAGLRVLRPAYVATNADGRTMVVARGTVEGGGPIASVGIDFGTTNCLVSAFVEEKSRAIRLDEPPLEWGELGFDRLFPSVFGLDEKNTPIFGWEAKMLPQNRKIEVIKRFLASEEYAIVGDKSFTLSEIATLMFAQLRKSSAQESGLQFNKAVVTIPYNSRGIARKYTKTCAAMGHIQVLALINEPTAAAMSVTPRESADRTSMIVDWGGGTLDVTVLDFYNKKFVERTSSGVAKLGGVDFDSAIMLWLSKELKEIENYSPAEKSLLRLDVERAKILLSAEEEVTIRLPRGDAVRFSREEFQAATNHLIKKAQEPLERCLADIAESNGFQDIHNLILVGGTCLIPAVRDFISEIVQLPPTPVNNPMTATAEGAAIASAILQGDLPDYQFKVSTQHALGVLAVSHFGEKPHFSTIIPRNQGLPARKTDRYTPVIDHQEWLNLTVVEGDVDKSATDESSVELQHWRVPIEDPRPLDEIVFDITYHYDTDGIIYVSVHNPLDQQDLFKAEVSNDDQDKRKLVEVATKARDTITNGVLSQTEERPHKNLTPEISESLIIARTKISPFIDSEESENLLSLCGRIEETNGSDTVLLHALENFKDKYSYLV